ncbi:MAG: pyridoxamine 5'-phosphate oxidase family protein [Planctomycetota bacterium]|nr:pyridoxamine 5'-phosphate oxidase family protein [Planctomycetota bacterium]MDA1200266.1 pyridoxamine 5'-phosphate oxidase family protein [Planctomycetota bacterium]
MTAAGWHLAGRSAAETWALVATELSAAVRSGRHPFHVFTIATLGLDGSPRSRTVVLRGFDGAAREIHFHTDARSPKAAELARDGRVALHWYDPTGRLQIRITALATLHHEDSIARQAWEAAAPMSRGCYTSPAAPGTPLPEVPPAPPPAGPDSTRGRACFAVVCCRFDAVELLALHATGHERLRLDLGGDVPTATILAP